ncbi:unnamed protein product [Ixodes hexagonus]
MSCPHLVEAESRPQITLSKPRPYNIFEDLEVFARFQHYRSESYAQAIHLMASQTSLRSDSRQSYASCVTTLKELSLSQSAPSSPKGIHAQEKSSTLPSTSSRVVSFPSPKKTSSLSLSSFFRRLSPRFHKSPKSKSKPWMVVEFSQKDIENNDFGAEGMADSDQSLELALQGKEQYMASLEDRRVSRGKVHFPGGSQPSLDAWVRAGKPKLFGPVQYPPQRPLSACLGRMSTVKAAQTSKPAQALPPCAQLQLHSSASGVVCHSHVTLMPVIVVDRPGRAPSLLDGSGMEQRGGEAAHPALIPHSLSAGAGTFLLSETRRAQPPQTLSIQGYVGAHSPSMERLGPKRASTESIGACSLDADASEASALEAQGRRMAKEASEVTLRSMVMSTRESSFVARGSVDTGRLPDGFVATGFLYVTPEGSAVQLSNGCWNVGGNTVEEWSSKVVEHRPSYLGISCAINGYASYSQFCRSRDSSPARPNHKSVASRQPPRAEPIVELVAPRDQTAFVNGSRKTSAPTIAAEMEPSPCWSLVQQRIASLYGSEAADRVARSRTRTAKSPIKLAPPKRSPSCPAQVVRGRSRSPPVFRHLTKNFREHLRLSEVSASPAENLPGYVVSPVKAATVRGFAASPENKHVVPVARTCEVDGGDSAALEGFAGRFAAFQPQVPNGDMSKVNGNHKVASSGEPEKGKRSDPEVHMARPALACPRALSSSDLPQREGHTFLATMASAQEALETRIRSAQEDLAQGGLSEDVMGKIRSAVGKANLLIAQKFQQFRELCLKNIDPKPDDPFPTTGSDLAGFWDMVMLQVENVHGVFDDLNSLKANNWQESAKTESAKSSIPKPTTTRKTASRSMPASPRRSAKGEEAARSREEARKRLMEAKRQARQANQVHQDSGVAIFMPQEKHN